MMDTMMTNLNESGIYVDEEQGQCLMATDITEEDARPFLCLWKRYEVPFMTCTFSRRDLYLSDALICDLKKLELLNTEDERTEQCKDLLEKYGSHISTSNTFGGIYWIRVESTNFTEKFKEIRKQLINEIIELQQETHSFTNISEMKGLLKSECEGSHLENTSISIHTVGGPANCCTFEQWRRRLLESQGTWKVIDRGAINRLVPLWNIMILNHRTDFQKCVLLANMIKNYWEIESGLQDFSHDLDSILEAEDILQSLSEKAEMWNRSEFLPISKCIEYITECTKFYYKTHMYQSASDNMWEKRFLCNRSIQTLLSKLPKFLNSQDTKHPVVKSVLQQVSCFLCESCEVEDPLCDQDVVSIIKMDEQILSIESVKEQFSQMEIYANLEDPLIKATQEMIWYRLYCILLKLKEIVVNAGEQYHQCLVTVLFYSYIKKSEALQRIIDWKELADRVNELEEHINDLKNMDKEEGQARVFLMALKEEEDSLNSKSEHTITLTELILDEMGSDLCPTLQSILKECGQTGLNLHHMRDKLNLFIKKCMKDKAMRQKKVVEVKLLISKSPNSTVPPKQLERYPSNTNEVIQLLDLEKFCKEKLTVNQTKKVHSVKLKLLSSNPPELAEVPWYFIRRLMMLHSNTMKLKCLKPQKQPEEIEEGPAAEDEGDGWFGDTNGNEHNVNPLDVVVAVFLCSDHFVQQELVMKMSLCQFAIPLLLPASDGTYTFLLWAASAVQKKWQTESTDHESCVIYKRLAAHPMAQATFIRLGDLQCSKSAFVNGLLGDSQFQHNFFMHSHLECGDVPRKISNGLIELAWYLPHGMENPDIFCEPCCILNLRGDAKLFPKQVGFLTEVSSVICLFVDNIGDEEERLICSFWKSRAKVFLLVNPTRKNLKANDKRLNILKSIVDITKEQVLIRTKKNDNEFISVVRSAISKVLTSKPKTMSLESMADHARRCGFNIDEDYAPCQAGKRNANSVLENLKKKNFRQFKQKLGIPCSTGNGKSEDAADKHCQESISEFKNKTFPFQGESWREYSKTDKESLRLMNIYLTTPYEYAKELNQKKKKIRQKQLQNDISSSVKRFVETLQSSTREERLFFLHWLRLSLDSVSMEVLPEIQRELTKCDDIKKKKALLDQLSGSSVGLEHFLREIGQIYEAFLACDTKLKSDLSSLPSVAAEILLDGFPFELIDGNVSNIPLRWVSDILEEVQNKTHPDTRIYVLSVLGVQSSGKSTLLNTLFGLQFAVGAGRCTRGAFMQLIHLDDDVKKDLGCDYILVIDTEGLRAPELLSLTNSYEQDNEMATLITGLSDIILVTLTSENITEMQDILQIVVHAMIRMRETGKKPNIYFIHQNVSDISASVLNMSGNRKLLEQLDIVTRAAAKQENKEKTYSRFSDVIQYDPSKISIYIPGLWHGVPPMVAVSNGYSEKVYELKTELLECMKKMKRELCSSINIISYIKLLEEISNAVKSEDFIFSFQNSLAADAFAKLSCQCNDWKWEIQKIFMEWREGAEIKIKNCEELDSLGLVLPEEAEKIANEKEEEYLKKLKEYYKNDLENKQHIEKDKQYFEAIIMKTCQLFKNSAVMGCRNLIKVCKSFNELMKSHREKIKVRVDNLVKEYKGKSKLSDDELREDFTKMWKETLDLFERPVSEVDIVHDMEESLLQSDTTKSKKVKEKLRHRPLREWGSKVFTGDTKPLKDENESRHHWTGLKPKKGIARMAEDLKEYTKSIFKRGAQENEDQRTTHMVMKEGVKYINMLVNKYEDYDPSFCMGVIKEIERQIKTLGDEKREIIDHLQVDIKLHVCGTAVQTFQEMHNRFIRKNDPLAKLEERKHAYWEMFSDLYHERDGSQRAAKRFCDSCLKVSLIKRIESQLSQRIVSDMRETWAPVKLKSIPNFQLALLINLHESGSFEDYKEYITDYDGYAQRWLSREVLEYCKDEKAGKIKLHSLAEEITRNMLGKVKDALEEVNNSKRKSSEDYLKQLKGAFEKRQVWIENQDEITIGNVEKFEMELSEAIKGLEMELKNQISVPDIECILDNLSSPPHEQLFELLKGCGEKCPCCGTPCELDGENHQHYSRHHRAFGVSNASPNQLPFKTIFSGIFWFLQRVVDRRAMNCMSCNLHLRGHNAEQNNWGELYKDFTSLYWQFVLMKYNRQFADFYKTKPVRLRHNLRWADVENDLENNYRIKLEDLREKMKNKMEIMN
ncbi:GVIN1 GTPase, partial [Polypterus senegalus]